jgi:hypothetical protein
MQTAPWDRVGYLRGASKELFSRGEGGGGVGPAVGIGFDSPEDDGPGREAMAEGPESRSMGSESGGGVMWSVRERCAVVVAWEPVECPRGPQEKTPRFGCRMFQIV